MDIKGETNLFKGQVDKVAVMLMLVRVCLKTKNWFN